MIRNFTGRHMAAILVAFFAVVIGVNFTMARYATSTFGGALADNGYVASQDYNRWIGQARAQDALGWTANGRVEGGRFVLEISGVEGARAEVRLVHPLGRIAETRLTMRPLGKRQFRSAERVPPGRWQAHVAVTSGARQARYKIEVAG